MVNKFIDTGNGYLAWRGDPSKMIIPDGYEKVPGIDDLIMPKLPDCKHRMVQTIEKKCCGKVDLMVCSLTSERATRACCKKCVKKCLTI